MRSSLRFPRPAGLGGAAAAAALLAAGAPPALGANQVSTFTSVSCGFSVAADQPAVCTARVTTSKGTVGGTMQWNVNTGSLPDGSTCALAGGGGTSTCSLRWLLPQPPPANVFARIEAVYPRNAVYFDSSGATFATFQAAGGTLGITCIAQPAADTSCTARLVSDFAGPELGDVEWTATGGGFPDGATCSLAPVVAEPSVSECRVRYVGNSDVAVTIRARYRGMWAFRPQTAELLTAPVPAPQGPTAPPATPPVPEVTACAGTQVAAALGARHVALAKQPPVKCPTPPKKSKKYAQYAEGVSETYGNQSDAATGMSGLLALLATAAAAVPGGQGVALALGSFSGISAMTSAALNQESKKWAKIAKDPPDPRYHVLARAPRTSAAAIPLAGLPAGAARDARAYLDAQVRLAALSECVATAIDRQAAAIQAGEADLASAQARAGAKCADQSAALGARLPRLAGPVDDYLDGLLARSRGLGLESGDARRAAAVKDVSADFAAVGRAVDLPDAELAALRREALRRIPRRLPKVVRTSVLEASAATLAGAAPKLRTFADAMAESAGG